MSDPRELTAEPAQSADPASAAATPGDVAEQPSPRWKRVLFVAFVTFAVVFFVAALLYRFGSMWPPSDETRAEYGRMVAAGEVEDEVVRQFHIPIPGCVCHSDDPVLRMQHSTRHVSQCMGCHGG